MPAGPGKYDHLATYVQEQTHAEGVVVIVINGDRGTGFSIQSTFHVLSVLADVLDTVSADIRKNMPRH